MTLKVMHAGVMLLTLAIGAATAQAATIVDFTGNTNGSLASGTITLDLAADQLSFTASMTNTSPFNAVLTGFGFDLGSSLLYSGSPDPITNPAGVNFDFTDGDLGNVPQFASANLDFGYLTGANFAGGNPGDGLSAFQTMNFMISGSFAGMTEAEILSGLFVRFQQVGLDGELSDVANPTPIPEPASLLLFGTGLAYLARRRMRSGNA